jgi:glycosyltransferase involved in cell wall biosynthesis
LLEGTYPYVPGGVSSWVHDIIGSLPDLSFALLHIGARRGTYGPAPYVLPGNVTELSELYCQVETAGPLDVAAREALEQQIRARQRDSRPRRSSRTLQAIRRLHLDDRVDDDLLVGLAQADLSVFELLHDDASFAVIIELYERLASETSFLDFFWHFRAMHVLLVRLLAAPLPDAQIYHSVSTGYAGLLGAVASVRTGRPFLLTEHGIYARERDMELSCATWIHDADGGDARIPNARPSQLRRFWSRFFAALSRVAYHQARSIVTLSEVNRKKQLCDGAPEPKAMVIPNGVDAEKLRRAVLPASPADPAHTTGPQTEAAADDAGAGGSAAGGARAERPLRVGFVGRVVPIKDVVTFIKACDLAMRSVSLDVRVIGPTDEEPSYVRRCRALVATLGRDHEIRFVGPQPMAELYADLDVVVLTSFSEGQPLVILEANAAGVPVIATDVGACRELLEGCDDEDRALGPSGLVTRVSNPAQTAAALVELAESAALRRRMGEAGRVRVDTYYGKTRMIDRYRALYQETLEA